MIDFGDGGDGRFAAAACDALLDGDRGWQALDQVHIRLFQLLNELPRIGRHAVEETALAFREKEVERDRRFAGAAQAGDDDQFVARDGERDVLEVVLARAVDGDGTFAFGCEISGERGAPPAPFGCLAERFFGGAQEFVVDSDGE